MATLKGQDTHYSGPTSLNVKVHGQNVLLSGDDLIHALFHSHLIRTLYHRAKREGKEMVDISLPDELVENIDIVNVITGRFHMSIYYPPCGPWGDTNKPTALHSMS